MEIPSTAILDAPRNQLDNIAVLNNRRAKDLTKLTPLVICWDLPNRRSDYWNVINDIFKITNIKIRTISLLSLTLIYWLNLPDNLNNDAFYLSNQQNEVSNLINILIEKKKSQNKFIGFFSPNK